MNQVNIASFESRTRGTVDVYRGHDDEIVDAIYIHSADPGITRTLGTKDLKRFSPDAFRAWVTKGGGRFMYTAWIRKNLAGLFWIGGEAFPIQNFPNSPLRPQYTAAWRTGYSTPEGGTYEGEGIGKRLALAGIADVVALTRYGGPEYVEQAQEIVLPPLAESGLWLDTGVGNTEGQALYHHLGNTDRMQRQIGFTDVGVYVPPYGADKTPQELEPRIGMVAGPETIEHLVVAAGRLLYCRA